MVPGTRLGVYEITALLGEGGMGQVYRATDTRLKRQVALKILPLAVAGDADRLSRFHREAEVLAALNHPHIAAIYGFEESGGVSALVMELVEGEDLSQRIARGAIATADALAIARQITEALDAAHEQGIVHRDLKPANIKVRADGNVKVLDFGLARALAPAAGSDAAAAGAAAATITSPAMTQAGVILGTAAYMSPEQARGTAVDRRADIWGFGCVFYEMLTGVRAFPGNHVSDVLASVLTREPEWALLPAGLPPSMVSYLRRCLHKDPKQRIHDIADVRLALEGAFDAVSVTPSPSSEGVTSARRGWGLPIGAAVLGAAASAAISFGVMPASAPAGAPVYRSTIVVNENLNFRAFSNRFRLSPDGRRLAYVALDPSGRMMLWVRALDSLVGQPLAGTDDATAPFWSPDSRVIAFFADEKLKRIDAGGGPVTVICAAPASTARRVTPGSWSRDDVILMSSPTSMTIAQVAAGGGTPAAVTSVNADSGESQHGFPYFLPDGRRFLYVAYKGLAPLGLYVGSLDGQAPVRVMDTESDAQYADGSLLFVRGATLMAQPFDLATLKPTGEAVALGERVLTNVSFMRAGGFSVSENGALVYQSTGGTGTARLMWSDRAGRQTAVVDERLQYRDLRLSPDGTRAAVSLVSARDDTSDVWVIGARGLRTRLTFDATDDVSAIWSPEGTDVVFSSSRTGRHNLFRKAVSGADREDVLLDDPMDKLASSWSSDGKFLLYSIFDARTGPDVWVLPLTGDRQPRAFLATAADERFARFSPDGRWVAYSSSESGLSEVYVARFPGPGGKQQISRAGGGYPRWRSDGQELFYQSPDNRLMAAALRVGSDRIEVEGEQPLFEMRAPDGYLRDFYDVASDGQRFMLIVPDETTSNPLTLVSSWPTLLKARN